MRRHLQLGNDYDVALLRVFDDRSDLVFGVVARRLRPHELARLDAADLSVVAARRNGREQGERFALHTIALIVRKVPMQHVELVQTHQIQKPLDLFLTEKVARLVEHQPAVFEARRVLDAAARAGDRLADGFEQLPERDKGVGPAGGVCGNQRERVAVDVDDIALVGQKGVFFDADGHCAVARKDNRRTYTRQHGLELRGDVFRVGAGAKPDAAVEDKVSAVDGLAVYLGNDIRHPLTSRVFQDYYNAHARQCQQKAARRRSQGVERLRRGAVKIAFKRQVEAMVDTPFFRACVC